jgi:hypothetical protein
MAMLRVSSGPSGATTGLSNLSHHHEDRDQPDYTGLMQADASAGFKRLYEGSRKGGPIIEAGRWAHARRQFFEWAQLKVYKATQVWRDI